MDAPLDSLNTDEGEFQLFRENRHCSVGFRPSGTNGHGRAVSLLRRGAALGQSQARLPHGRIDQAQANSRIFTGSPPSFS